MKTLRGLALAFLGAVGLLVPSGSARAAGPGPGDGPGGGYTNHYGDSSGSGWFTNMARWSNSPAPRAFTNQYQTVAPKPGQRSEPPGPRPGGPLTPADVQALVQQFQQDRQAFMAKQQALEQQMQGLSEQERQRLRAQLKDQMEEWKQQQARLRERLRDQCDRLAEQLRDHSRLINRVGDQGTSPGGSGSDRPRGR